MRNFNDYTAFDPVRFGKAALALAFGLMINMMSGGSYQLLAISLHLIVTPRISMGMPVGQGDVVSEMSYQPSSAKFGDLPKAFLPNYYRGISPLPNQTYSYFTNKKELAFVAPLRVVCKLHNGNPSYNHARHNGHRPAQKSQSTKCPLQFGHGGRLSQLMHSSH